MAALFVFRIASRRWSAQHTCRLLGLRRLCTHSGDNLRRRNAEEVLVKIGEALHGRSFVIQRRAKRCICPCLIISCIDDVPVALQKAQNSLHSS